MKIKCFYLKSEIPRKRERERERIDTASLWYINKYPIQCKPRKEDILDFNQKVLSITLSRKRNDKNSYSHVFNHDIFSNHVPCVDDLIDVGGHLNHYVM